MPRLTWKREERLTGLQGVGQGYRGWDLNYGAGNTVGSVGACYKGFFRLIEGYYFFSRVFEDETNFNSGNQFATEEEAKAACLDYVKAKLKVKEGN